MQTVAAFAAAVEAEAAEAARFMLEEGDCAVIDNYRAAHGREPCKPKDPNPGLPSPFCRLAAERPALELPWQGSQSMWRA